MALRSPARISSGPTGLPLGPLPGILDPGRDEAPGFGLQYLGHAHAPPPHALPQAWVPSLPLPSRLDLTQSATLFFV